jgi:hypothetical protein
MARRGAEDAGLRIINFSSAPPAPQRAKFPGANKKNPTLFRMGPTYKINLRLCFPPAGGAEGAFILRLQSSPYLFA